MPLRTSRSVTAFTLLLAAGGLLMPARAASEAAAPRSIEVLIEQPPDNFAYQHGDRVVYGADRPTGGGDAFFAGLDPISVAVSVAVNVSIQSRVNRFFAQDAPAIRASVERLDLRATAAEQLMRLAPPAGPRLVVATDGFPVPALPVAVEPRPDSPVLGRRQAQPATPRAGRWDHFVQRAKISAHDAVLYVKVEPVYHLRANLVRMQTRAWLFSRSGSQLHAWTVSLAGADLTGIPEDGWHRWWTEGRYRQFVLHGLRAGLQLIRDDLADPASQAERSRQIDSLRQGHLDPQGRPVDLVQQHLSTFAMLTSACALEPPERPVRYVYSVGIRTGEFAVMAKCLDEQPSAQSPAPPAPLVWARDRPEPLAFVERAPPTDSAAPAPLR